MAGLMDRDVQVERFMKRINFLGSRRVASFRPVVLRRKEKLASHILDNNGSRDQLVSQVVKHFLKEATAVQEIS